jgi:hypothetical protein
MHTPYIIVHNESVHSLGTSIEMQGREAVRKSCGSYTIYLFPPTNDRCRSDLEQRVSCEGDRFRMEEGFMVRYPEPYQPDVRKKEELFQEKSIKLDGAYSRISIDDGTLKVDGSATYLQMMFSYQEQDMFVLSNNLPILEQYIERSGGSLSLNSDFFASHLIQYPLAFYVFAGTQWNEIQYHDSLDTLTFDGKLNISIENKLHDPDFESLDRGERFDLLYARLTHAVNEFTKWTGVSKINHHLTAGRDSRTSFGMFKENFSDKLLIETGGHPHTTDRVVSNYISKFYGIKSKNNITPTAVKKGSGFSYRKLLDTRHAYRPLVALFRLQHYREAFNPDAMIANGYLGNSLVYMGSEKRQLLPFEGTALTREYYDRLAQRYQDEITRISEAYGNTFAHRIFHLMYHTANKVSSTLVRLQGFGFCLYESDLLYLSYMLEGSEGMTQQIIHYELMKRADPTLVHCIPFEPGKAFPEHNRTSEVPDFKGVKRIGGHMIFLDKNLSLIADHFRNNADILPFFRTDFIDQMSNADPRNTAQSYVVNKTYGLLGAFEYFGRPLEGYNDDDSIEDNTNSGDIYNVDFFEKVYFDNAVHVSGLPGTTYSKEGIYRVFWQAPEGHEFIVKIISTPVEKPQAVSTEKVDDGFIVRYSLDRSSRFRVIHLIVDPETKKSKEVFRTHFSARDPNTNQTASN